MQATVRTTNGFGFDRLKVALVAVGVLATTIAGTAAVRLTHDTADTRIAAPVTTQQPAWRIAEINQLPAASHTAVSDRDIRFAEMNLLPMAAVEATTSARIWFVEANTLPDATVAAPAGHDTDRFLEINQLPGDGDMLVVPTIVNGVPS